MKTNDRGLSAWQITMLALGTVVGGSFFLGSAVAIKTAGPAIIFSYLLGGLLVYIILFSLSEMTVANPDPGSFRTYCENMFGPGVGFVTGWVYWSGLVLAMSSEAIAAATLLRGWFPDIPLPLTGIFIITSVTLVNLIGIDRLSKIESTLAGIKLLALIGFIILAATLITGLFPGKYPLKTGALQSEMFFSQGLKGIAGSMLIVMFTYAGFEIAGLAAPETNNPRDTIPRAILYTVLVLVGIYTTVILLILPLIPTDNLSEGVSPLVAALSNNGLYWAGNFINIILITAILSTMIAATFGIGCMIYSLAEEGHAPAFLKDKEDTPLKGIIFSGTSMLAALLLGFILPERIYLFLVSSGGFSLLFVYVIILATHYKFRKTNGCPPEGKCQLPWYPYSSLFALILLIAIICSMPLVPGQGSGLTAGLVLVIFYIIIYLIKHIITNFNK